MNAQTNTYYKMIHKSMTSLGMYHAHASWIKMKFRIRLVPHVTNKKMKSRIPSISCIHSVFVL